MELSAKEIADNDWQKACDGVLGILSLMGCAKGSLKQYVCFYRNLLSFLVQRKLINKPVDKKHTNAFLQFSKKRHTIYKPRGCTIVRYEDFWNFTRAEHSCKDK